MTTPTKVLTALPKHFPNAATLPLKRATALSPNVKTCRLAPIIGCTRCVATTTTPTDSISNDITHLQKTISSFPYITTPPAPSAASTFNFPLATLFKAPNPEIGLSLANAYARALRTHGICAIELGFTDPDSTFLLDVVFSMFCSPDTHSATQGTLWDVKYKPEGVKSESGKDGSAHSISHSLGEFAWHTDAAFEQHPTRFFGFHIIHPDRHGGGVFRVLRAEDLLSMLSPSAVKILTTQEFDLRVPPEFYKGREFIRGRLLKFDPATGRIYIRYRRDILCDPPSEDAEANAAVNELVKLLDQPENVGEMVPTYAFKENTVLLMDNARYLHSRTNIKDPRRWLRRVRFHGTPGKDESLRVAVEDA